MGDDELAAIRARRMAQMQAQQAAGGGQGGGAPGMPGGPGGPDGAKQAEEKRAQVEDMKNSILTQVLTQEARARLNTLTVAKPEKGAQIEAMLIRMAQTGQLGGKMGEDEFVGLLEKISEANPSKSSNKVKFDRRRAAMDSDDDDF